MSDEEKRQAYGAGTLGTGVGTLGAFGTGCCATTLGAFFDFCPDDVFIQILCQLKGQCVKVLTEAEEEGIICGTLVTIGRNFIAVTVDGSVAYILLTRIVAIIPVS